MKQEVCMKTQKTIHLIRKSCNIPQIPLTDKTQEKHGDKVLNTSIDEIRSRLKTITISIKERLIFFESQLRETRNKITKITFSNIVLRTDFNAKLRNFYNQKNIGFINNGNINESHFGMKKLHLNRKRKLCFS